MALIDQVYDTGGVIEHLGEANSSLHREVEDMKNGADPEAVAVTEQRASDLE